MRPDRLSLRLRPRSALEAIDLGFALTQRHAADIRRAWLHIVLPVMLVLALLEHLLPGESRFTCVLLWLAKPFYDIVILLVLSRAIFGERIAMPALRAELRAAARVIAGALTVRRFSLSRSFLLPVHLLEGLEGPAKRERITLLRTETTGSARLATLAGGWMEMSLGAGFAALVLWITPAFLYEQLFDAFSAQAGHLVVATWQLLYMLVVALVEPFYVAAGFALYLNRRTQLEGWDIEVALRRLDARLPVVAGDAATQAGRP